MSSLPESLPCFVVSLWYLIGFRDDDLLLQGETCDDNVMAVTYSLSRLD